MSSQRNKTINVPAAEGKELIEQCAVPDGSLKIGRAHV